MPISEAFRTRISSHLEMLYGDDVEAVLGRIDVLADRYQSLRSRDRPLWDQDSVVMITYGDQVQSGDQPALQVLGEFLREFELERLISSIHILPFFPYSSDDGFSVIDYREVNPSLGTWPDVQQLGQSHKMMFDFVVNHCSQQNEWFQAYLRAEPPYTEYFIDVDPATDLSAVTRPRSSPLLTPYETSAGTRHVWTTFSADQIDLNFASPDLLLEALDILLFYAEQGASIIRLDAIGFLWKKIGTTCMHLPETHAAVKLMRAVLDDVAPGTVLITETNVPHDENISYFGDGDEAHAVYQFSLAPLLLDAFLSGDATPLNRWLSELQYPGRGMTFFNFTASHDGIGVRPLEGLVSQQRLDELVEHVRRRGGQVNMRRKPDGTDVPYELNITYFSALGEPDGISADDHARRFLTSQGIMLALRGMPGVYFHSLVGTANFEEGVQQTGHNRTINRRKFDLDELRQELEDPQGAPRLVLEGYRRMLEVRTAQPAFHPDASQSVIDMGHGSIIAFTRTSQDNAQTILVVANVGGSPLKIDTSQVAGAPFERDLLSGQTVADELEIVAYGQLWLA